MIPSSVLLKLKRHCENERIRRVTELFTLLRRRPAPGMPVWDVYLCLSWLRTTFPKSNSALRWLDLVEVTADGQEWVLNGELQGGPWELVKWIASELPHEDPANLFIEYVLDFAARVKDAHEKVRHMRASR